MGALAKNSGLTWIWCPLEGADINAPFEQVRAALQSGSSAVRDGATLVIHCSAGIHRTGMFGYAFLRVLGLDQATDPCKLRELRAIAAEGVGAERLQWGDQMVETLAERTDS